MQCPKCGNENPDDAQMCGACRCILTKSDQTRFEPGKGGWALAVIGSVLMGLSAGLVVFLKPTCAFIAALLACCSFVSDVRRNWKKPKIKGRAIGVAILTVICLQMLILSYLRIDAAPIAHDYTISDLRSAPPECNRTYELLGQLTDVDLNVNDMSPIGLTAQEIRRLEEIHDLCKEKDLGTITRHLQDNTNDIMKMWRDAEKGREVLTKLNEFPEIADRGEPSLEIERSWFVSLRHLAYLHRAYVCLQSSQGRHQTAADTLLEYESFVRKLSLNARSMITNLVCLACSATVVDMANFIINNSETPPESLQILGRQTIPLSPDHMSLKNALISEHIAWKKRFLRASSEFRPEYRYRAIDPLKLNSTLRLSRNFLDGFIAIEAGGTQAKEFKVWPVLYPNLSVKVGRDGELPWYYKMYNPFGAKVIAIYAPAIYRVRLIRTSLQTRSDLVKIVLDKRLGRSVSLKARAFESEYIVDAEDKKILSPGPDEKAGTKDDISLPINPEVLKWDSLGKRENGQVE